MKRFLWIAPGPNYRRPQVPLPGAFRNAPPAGSDAGSLGDTKWQSLFPDDTMNAMVSKALANNFGSCSSPPRQTGPTAWMTCRALRSPPVVMTASPIGQPPMRRHSS